MPVTKHIHRQIVIAFSLILAVCIALTVSFYIFSRNGAQVQHEEAAHSLEATAETARNIVNSHIQGNLQTLVTLSSFIGYDSADGLNPQQQLHNPAFLDQLDVVNSPNEFLRMGVVDTSGQGSFVLLDGRTQLEQDLSQDSAVQRALAGEGNVSFTFWDDTLGCYVNRYAVPIYQGGVDGPVIGVLTVTNNTDALQELLSPSLLLNGQVHAHIVNSEGKFVVRNQTYFIREDARSIFDTSAFSDELQQTILSAFAVNESAFLSLTNEGTLYEVALIPMGINDWYIMCVVPQRILVTDLSQWFNLQRITFFVIFLLVILLALYIYRMMRQNNRSMRKLAYFDSITGAYNRALFLQEMPAKLTADPKALIVLDIDNAPTIKNLYGLERFNSLLRHIKETLDQQMGPNELFCMGRNERFLLLLDCTTPGQVQQRMSRFFTQIRQFRVSEHQNYQAVCSAAVRHFEPLEHPAPADRAGGHRKPCSGKHRPGARGADRAAQPGLCHLDGRFRQRLLLAEHPEGSAHRRAEARPGIPGRPGRDRRGETGSGDEKCDPSGPGAAHHHRGGGRGNHRPGGLYPQHAL